MSSNDKLINIQWYPGHMNKAKNEIIEKLRIVDIALVLLDARIPYSSQNPMLFDILGNKPKLILLTKSTMADSNMTNKWINHFSVFLAKKYKLHYNIYEIKITIPKEGI